MSEIVNRVASSPIISLDLEEFYPQEERVIFDLRPFLFQELILKEKDFREQLKTFNWAEYADKWVAVTCTADAIVPTWSFMLVCTYLEGVSKGYVIGDRSQLEQHIAELSLSGLDLEKFHGRPVVIKGCSKVSIPLFAYGRLISLLQGRAKSLMFGEPCSTVPLIKNKRG